MVDGMENIYLGITVRQVFDDAVLPFENAYFTLFVQTLLLYLYFGYTTIRAKNSHKTAFPL